MAGQPGFFDLDERHEMLSVAGDPLKRLAAVGNFELFRDLEAALDRSDRVRGGRPPYDAMLMSRSWSCRRSTRSRTTRPSIR